MKKLYLSLAALAMVAVLGAGLGVTWAYFTTYAEAQGGYVLRLGDETRIEETFTNWTKHVSIVSGEGSEPVYVRARAYCGSAYTLAYSSESEKWEDGGDGFWYYMEVLPGGGTAETLDVRIGGIPADEDLSDGDGFNVVVVYESAPVKYGADGNALPSLSEGGPNPEIWSVILDSVTETGGAQ